MNQIVTKQIRIDCGHRVPNHDSKCKNIHGHNYLIELGVYGEVITTQGTPDEGMVIDFSDLKKVLMEEIDERFDHNSVFYEKDQMRSHLESLNSYQTKRIQFVPFIPTAENLAKYWFELMEPKLVARNIKIHHVTVWETLSSTATYQI